MAGTRLRPLRRYDDPDFILELSDSELQQLTDDVGMLPGHKAKFLQYVRDDREKATSSARL